MPYGALVDSNDYFRRVGTAKRARTLAPVVPSQDATRYQATDMPRPTYDLDGADRRESPLKLLILALAVVVTGAGIALIQRIGTWLTR
jgi:hypothetical protein